MKCPSKLVKRKTSDLVALTLPEALATAVNLSRVIAGGIAFRFSKVLAGSNT